MKEHTLFGNKIPKSKARTGEFLFKHYAKKNGFDPSNPPKLSAVPSEKDFDDFGILHIVEDQKASLTSTGNFADVNGPYSPIDTKNAILIGTIRMGFGHCRMAMAIASAARHKGLTPYWLDMMSFPDNAASKTIRQIENWYNLGSRLSQNSQWFNRVFWERITSDAGLRLSGALRDKTISQIYAPLFVNVPKGMPFVSTHPWVGHGSVAAGVEGVVTIIPDNYPLAFHLVEGSTHAVQSPSAYMGYRAFISMGEDNNLEHCLPKEEIREVGHYIDHEIVSNIEYDCSLRLARLKKGCSRRFLLTMGGAGAQVQKFADIVGASKDAIKNEKATFFINMGDHKGRWEALEAEFKKAGISYTLHDTWKESRSFIDEHREKPVFGVHVFLHENFYAAVYATNLLMRISDVMITKPSELSFYPVPKLFIQRVGRHEAWGAIRGSEIGDGTIETGSVTSMHRTLKLLIEDTDLIELYCDHIVKNYKQGIYNGAYNTVDLALELQGR
jgi:hypothetical protein